MWRSRLLWKLYASYAALVVFTVAVIGILVLQRAEMRFLKSTAEELDASALLLAELAGDSLSGEPEPAIREMIGALGRATGICYEILRLDGTRLQTVASSDTCPSLPPADLETAPELLAALEQRGGASLRTPEGALEPRILVARPVEVEGRVAGCVRASLPRRHVEERVGELQGTVVLGGALAAVMALLVGLVVARRITGRLRAVAEAAQAFARGDYSRRAPVASRDEIAELARVLNDMALELRSRMDHIARERNKLLTILDGMVEGVLAVDAGRRVIHINKAAGRLLGVRPETAPGKPLWELVRLPELERLLEESAQAPDPRTGEVTVPGEGGPRIFEVYASPLRDEGGRPSGAVLILHDVTRLRRLEVVRQDFVANVSHELKTPVTAIRGLVETLLDTADMDAATRTRFIERVRTQTNRLSSLVSDLLTLSRLESQPGGLERHPLDLRGIVFEAVRAARPSAQAKGLRLESTIPQEPLVVAGEEEALRQIADNLLSNAIRYTPEGGRVEVRLAATDSTVLLEVEDTGIGIASEHLERIFERFYRVDKARSRELGGTGLGLSIVKHFAAALGGEVSVRSRPGEGSTFTVRFPRSHGETGGSA